jgi:hypothetical protein
MGRRRDVGVLGSGLGLLVSVAVVLGLGSTQAAAFPGETAQEMIARHGPPSLPTSIPPPPVALLRAGKPSSVLIVWFQTKYHPLSLPMELEGRVIASCRFDGPAVLRRIERGEQANALSDLRSDFENLFTTLSESEFKQFLGLLEKHWAITKKTPHADPPYDLYEAVSRDGKLKAEFSFRTPGVPSPSASDPYYGGKFPDGNFWVRVQRAGA